MKKFNYVIKDETGIHARPAGLLVKLAGQYESSIAIKNTNSGKSADAKKIFAVMGLGAKRGTDVEITITGADEEKAQKALEEFFTDNL